MKDNFEHFILKEIYEQPDALMMAIKGRLDFEKNQVMFSGLVVSSIDLMLKNFFCQIFWLTNCIFFPIKKEHLPAIRRCRRIILIGSGSSYHAAVATQTLLEDLTLLPVNVSTACHFNDKRSPIYR